MVQQHVVLAFSWLLFCALHSALATTKMKGWFSRKMHHFSNYYRLIYTLFAVVSLGAVIIFQASIPSSLLFIPSTAIKMMSVGLLIIGSIVMFICIRKYFVNLSGVKSLYSQESAGNKLRIDGIHKYVRHPLYTGTFFTIWGMVGLLPYVSFFIAAFIITVYTVYAIKWEEQKLIAEFGDAYKQYKHSVPRLFPTWRSLYH